MNKTIIAVYGRAGEGKSATIKNVVTIFETLYPTSPIQYLLNDGDVLAIVTLGTVKIGIESQGDPNSRMISENTIEQLIQTGCDIIICATRTEGMTTRIVDQLADNYGYFTLWKSSYYTNGLNHDAVNKIAAEEIIEIVLKIISCRI